MFFFKQQSLRVCSIDDNSRYPTKVRRLAENLLDLLPNVYLRLAYECSFFGQIIYNSTQHSYTKCRPECSESFKLTKVQTYTRKVEILSGRFQALLQHAIYFNICILNLQLSRKLSKRFMKSSVRFKCYKVT